MPISELLTASLEVLRLTAGGQDAKGNSVAGYESHLTGVPTMAWEQAGVEDREGRWVNISTWLAYVPYDTDVTVKDRVVYEGRTFEVRDVAPFRSPRNNNAIQHIRLVLEEMT